MTYMYVFCKLWIKGLSWWQEVDIQTKSSVGKYIPIFDQVQQPKLWKKITKCWKSKSLHYMYAHFQVVKIPTLLDCERSYKDDSSLIQQPLIFLEIYENQNLAECTSSNLIQILCKVRSSLENGGRRKKTTTSLHIRRNLDK